MTDMQNVIEGRLKSLNDQVEFLQETVEHLSARLSTLEKGMALKESPREVVETTQAARRSSATPQQGVLKKAGTGSLLPRVAAVCFALVVALILRTITDNGIVNTQLGSILGTAYAAALILGGWLLYSRQNRLAPVFPACGLLLLFSVVLETHSRFHSLSAVMAYIILFAAAAVVVVLGLRYRASFQLCIAALGTGLVAMSIDFPYPFYPILAVVLMGGSVAAYLANRQKLCPSLRWTTFGLVILFWLFWAFKLNVPAVCDVPTADLLHLNWFFPFLFVFWAFYTVTNIHRVATNKEDLGFYESLLPTVTGVGAFMAAWYVIVPWYRNTLWLGLVGALVAVLHFVVGGWLASHNKEGAIGSTTYTFAGVILSCLGVAAIFANILWAVPILSVAAYLLARIASRWESGGIRCTSYLFQLAAGFVAAGSGVLAADIAYPLGMLAARFLAYGLGMFVITNDPEKNLFWINNMILIQVVDLATGVFYTATGVVGLSLSGFPMFNAMLFIILLWLWRPKPSS